MIVVFVVDLPIVMQVQVSILARTVPLANCVENVRLRGADVEPWLESTSNNGPFCETVAVISAYKEVVKLDPKPADHARFRAALSNAK